MQNAPRYIERNRRELRRFRTLKALIIHHSAKIDTDPEDRGTPFMCGSCGHSRRLCTCQPARVTA